MSLGVNVTSRLAPPARGAETDISAWHVVFTAAAGSTTAYKTLHSLADFATEYGARAAGNQLAYDAVDGYFRNGGRTVYAVRSTDTSSYDDALALLPDKPGQVSVLDATPIAVGGTVSTVWDLLEYHAQSYNKRAIYDMPTGLTVAELTALGSALPQSRYGAAFGPWVVLPGVNGSTRSVPASGVVAGMIAYVDRQGNPNRAAAGRKFPVQYVESLAVEYTQAEVNTLNSVGINSLANVYNVLEVYGFDTPAYSAVSPDKTLGQLNASRTEMYIVAQSKGLGEQLGFDTIDGGGHLTSDLKGVLDGMLLSLYRVGGLFGATPSEAFHVDVDTVNTPDTAYDARLVAVASFRPSQHAREVDIELISVPVNVAV